MNIRNFLLLLGTATFLTACDNRPEEEPIEEEQSADPADGDEVSILRPDVEQPEQTEEVLLEPLSIVIGFPEGGSKLDEDAITKLEEVLGSEQLATGAKITLGGHSDASGNAQINERTSRQRAEAVRDWLVEKGVEQDRITIIAFGEQNPVEPNALPDGEPNESGRAKNRRVEITINPPEGTTTTTPQPEEKSAEASD